MRSPVNLFSCIHSSSFVSQTLPAPDIQTARLPSVRNWSELLGSPAGQVCKCHPRDGNPVRCGRGGLQMTREEITDDGLISPSVTPIRRPDEVCRSRSVLPERRKGSLRVAHFTYAINYWRQTTLHADDMPAWCVWVWELWPTSRNWARLSGWEIVGYEIVNLKICWEASDSHKESLNWEW